MYERQMRRYRFFSSPSDNNHGRGYDGVDETTIPSRLTPSPTPSASARSPPRRAKRCASHFSLRSLSKTFSKRPRIGFRKWANSIYRESSRRFGVAKQKIRRHPYTETRDFSAIKTQSPRSKKTETPRPQENGALSVAPCRKNQDWWKEVVAKHHVSKRTKVRKA